MTLKYFSQFYKLDISNGSDWFDARMDLDTKLYIDPFLVFKSDIDLFKNAQHKFVDFFDSAFDLAFDSIESPVSFKVLVDILTFPEAHEICLGDSKKGVSGAGPGIRFAEACAHALRNLARKGQKGLRSFEEIEIFTKGIGQDGISDATATILKKEFILYTKKICDENKVEMKPLPIKNIDFNFDDLPDIWMDGSYSLPINPFPRTTKSGRQIDFGVILVPKEFLCASHAISSDGFSEYIQGKSSQELRNSLNFKIEKSIGGKVKNQPKSTIIEIAEQYPKLVEEYIQDVESNRDNIEPYNLEVDSKDLYRNQRKSGDFVLENPLAISAFNEDDFIRSIELIINQFKLYVEDRDGYRLLWNDPYKDESCTNNNPTPRKENIAQSLFSGIVSNYCQSNDITLSREPNLGRGPVDFKFSSGYKNSVLVELKLARSNKLEHGALKQLPQYLKTEDIHHGYYIVIIQLEKDVEKLRKVRETIDLTDFGNRSFKMIAIDATRDKPSASIL